MQDRDKKLKKQAVLEHLSGGNSQHSIGEKYGIRSRTQEDGEDHLESPNKDYRSIWQNLFDHGLFY